jgi:competence protein ComEC
VLRSGSEVIVFDAGTMGDPGSGARIVVPALRTLGVRRVDTLIISHANLDHFSAMLEVVDAFGADEVLVTPQFLNEASDVASPPAALLEGMHERGVEVVTVSRGEARTFGEAAFEWIHPPSDAAFEAVNDAAMVVRIDAAGRRILLCGDVQAEAMSMITAAEDAEALRADVIELPHHGSFRDDAVAFVQMVSPRVVLQSTGHGRLRRDRWAEVLAESHRLITARDGACWVEVDDEGVITPGAMFASPH